MATPDIPARAGQPNDVAPWARATGPADGPPPTAPPSAFRPPPAGLRLATFIIGTLVFLLIAADVHFDGRLTRIDAVVGEWVHDQVTPAQSGWFREVGSAPGHDVVIFPLMILAMAGVAALGRWRTAILMGVSLSIERLAVWTLKAFFAEERPIVVIAGEDTALYSFAFPSGHAAVSTLWYGLILYFGLYAYVSRTRRDPRPFIIPAILLWAVIFLTASFSRVAGGVHWPTDVVASIAMALAWMAATITAHEAWVRPFEQLAAGRRPGNEAVL